MNKYLIVSIILLFAVIVSSFSQSKKPLYISPNNDGVMDELVVPLSIKDKRYITEWSLVIIDSNENVVRTIGNKEKRPEKMSLKVFFQQLFSKKEGVNIPESVMWNGILDSGDIAPDGKYFYYVTAADDNGNIGQTQKYEINVDNTEPYVEITQPRESAKIFGAGTKPTITIPQKGSAEDLWTGKMLDVNGQEAMTWTWTKASPEDVVWDGKNSFGVAVSEGVYTYKITATDRAGNVSNPAQVTNIIYDAIPRSVNMTVKDSPFSPNGDGVRDLLNINPAISNSTGLVSWDITALDKNGNIVNQWTGIDTPPVPFDYDGQNSSGLILTDGDYQLKFRASFNNGQESVISRNFTIDNTPPSVVVRADSTIFSPDGDGKLDSVTFTQEVSKEKNWIGEICDENGEVIKSFDFGELPPTSIVWNGTGKDGLINDGFYTYRVSSVDLAGNKGSAVTGIVELNTGTTEIILTVNEHAFSPNGDKVKDSLTFTPQIKTKSGVVEYKLSIINTDGTVVKTFADKKPLPKSINWLGTADDGSRCLDGTYTASLFTISKNGSESTVTTQPFVIDTVYPQVELKTPYLVFSPNADSNKDVLPIEITTSTENRWSANISDIDTNIVKSFMWEGLAQSFDWDGCDEAGNIVTDGDYIFTISSEDDAGNKVSASISDIKVDTRIAKAYLTAEYDSFAPNADGISDVMPFAIMITPTDGVQNWKFSINGADGVTVREWTEKDSADVPSEIKWDGTTSNGNIVEGTFTAVLNVEYVKGDVVSVTSSSFICSITPPMLEVKTAPQYFSPDNDGEFDELYINLKGTDVVPFTQWSFEVKDPQNGKPFWKVGGKSLITERIIWDGRSNSGELVQSATDYPYTFTVTDELGMTSIVNGIISVDVLVIRVGDVLKMQIPSIIFRGNNADFKNAKEVSEGPKADRVNKGLEQAVIDNNNRVLKRIADILNKFRDYNVTIEGHANNVSGTEAEETIDNMSNYGKALVPLSEARASYVKEQLVKYGVDSLRLSTIGIGGRQPVAARNDKDNWWKNRRVEFILIK